MFLVFYFLLPSGKGCGLWLPTWTLLRFVSRQPARIAKDLEDEFRNWSVSRLSGCIFYGGGAWNLSFICFFHFDYVQVWVSSKFDQTLVFESLSFIKVWSNFDFESPSFIKLWFSKSEFYQSLTTQSLSFVKVWLYKLIVLSNFDSKIKTLMKVRVYNQTLTKLRFSKLKVWGNSYFQNSKFDQNQTLKFKLWWNSDFRKSKFDQTLMKLRLSKLNVWSNFDETLTLFWPLLKKNPGIGSNFRLSAWTGWRSTESLDAGSMLAIAQWQSTSLSQKKVWKKRLKVSCPKVSYSKAFHFSFLFQGFTKVSIGWVFFSLLC